MTEEEMLGFKFVWIFDFNLHKVTLLIDTLYLYILSISLLKIVCTFKNHYNSIYCENLNSKISFIYLNFT